MKRSVLCVLLLCVMAGLVSPVAAQETPGVGRLTLQAPSRVLGLSAGGFVFLPRMGVSWGYDSNVFYEANNQYEQPDSAHTIMLVPRLSVRNRSDENVKIDLAGGAELRQYAFGPESLQSNSRVAGDVALGVVFFRRSPVTLEIREQFKRTLDRRNIESAGDFNRHINRVGAALSYSPGGRAIRLTGSYHFVADLFTDTANDWGDLVYHDVGLRGSWKFRPYTSAILDVRWQHRSYLADGTGHYGELTDSSPLWARMGVAGFVTRRLSVGAMAGWGSSFHGSRNVSPDEKKDTPTSGDSYNGPIGELRLGVRISPVSIADVAYLYSFRDSVFSNYVTFHRIGLSYEQRIAERVEVKLLTAYSYLTYAQAPRGILYNPNQGHVAEITTGYERVDGVLDAGLSVSVDIARYLAFEFTYKVSWLNDLVNEGGNFGIRYSDGSVDYVGFTRHVAMGTVVVRY